MTDKYVSADRLLRNLVRNAKKGDIRSIYQLYINYLEGNYTTVETKISTEYLKQLNDSLSKSKLFITELSFFGFRGLKSLKIKLEKRLTVIIGNNGAGKSTILDGLALDLSWLKSNILREDRPGNFIRDSDINTHKTVSYSSISSTFVLAEKPFQLMLQKSKDGSKEKRNNDLSEIKILAGIYRHTNSYNENLSLPLLAYYSVSRSNEGSGINLKKSTSAPKTVWSKFDAYDDVLDDRHDFREFLNWLVVIDNIAKQNNNERNITSINIIKSEIITATNFLTQLESMPNIDKNMLAPFEKDIQNKRKQLIELENNNENKQEHLANKIMHSLEFAFSKFLPDLKNISIKYSTNDVKLVMQKNGVFLDAQQLSQGEKSILTLIGDITRRLVILNPGLSNPLTGTGIVLIDEVDLHLHPSWQQKIILNLLDTFPNLQFIITTHSPQVLSTIDDSSIRIIKQINDDGEQKTRVEQPPYQTKGVISADILSQIMFTDPKPEIAEAIWLDDYKDIIESGDLESELAKNLEVKLIRHFGRDHPLMIECESLKAVRNMKEKLLKNRAKKEL
jgi:predicted ATP-binding protein involved in virulence